MADLVRALTEAWEKIGGIAVLTLAILVGAGYVVYWNRRLVDMLDQAQGKTIKENTAELANNSAVIAEQNAYLKKFGSDPTKLCKAEVIKEGISLGCDAKALAKAYEAQLLAGKIPSQG